MNKLHSYFKNVGPIFWRWLDEPALVDYICSHIEPFDKVHEFGCGDGRLIYMLNESHPEKKYVGHDLSTIHAKEILEDKLYKGNIELIEEDIDKLSLPKDSIECGIAAFLFEYTEKESLTKVSDAIKPDGKLICAFHRSSIGKVAKGMSKSKPFNEHKGFKYIVKRLKKWSNRKIAETYGTIAKNGLSLTRHGTYLDSVGSYSAHIAVFEKDFKKKITKDNVIITYDHRIIDEFTEEDLTRLSEEAVNGHRMVSKL
jgi:ubiquinone/menaquinone biosynthesis C-methylase UbiE